MAIRGLFVGVGFLLVPHGDEGSKCVDRLGGKVLSAELSLRS